jgi:Mrp family chromosome partitioning ATPase
MFDQLKKQYDCIVIDTSPIGFISDAMILDRFADVTIYVVRQDYTPKDRIRYINELYDTKRLNNLGVVVNAIKEKKWNSYDYGYTYGTYKYYKSYENDK